MKTFVLVASLMLFSCTQEQIIVVHRDIPETPTFTVMASEGSTAFATEVEKALLRARVKVVTVENADFILRTSVRSDRRGEIRVIRATTNELISTFSLLIPIDSGQQTVFTHLITTIVSP